LPGVDRTLNFRVTARDNRAGGGGGDWDSMQVTVSGAPFQIVSPAQGAQLECGDTATIAWNVGGGSVAPNVDILISADGGASFSTLVAGTANDGSEQVTVPKTLTGLGRVMLKPTTQCFCAVSKNVSIADTKAPSLTAPPKVTAECSSATGTPVSLGTPTVTDLCDPSPKVTNNAPAVFPLGITTVVWTAQDASGNQRTAPELVEIQDTTPPTITNVSATPNVLWPPNHELVPVTLAVSVTDVCDAAVAQSCHIVSVTSNEAIAGAGSGHTSPDWEITGSLIANLRAERSGLGSGRTYTLTVQCTDASNNSSTAGVTVTVPHDQGKI